MAKIPSISMIPSGYKKDKIYSVLPTSGAGDFDFTRSSSATRVNARGLIETVATGVPRLEYSLLNGVVNDCPSLLLEPSVTNYITNSETSAFIEYNNANSVTSNSGISPDGIFNAIKIDSNANDIADSYRNAGSGVVATFSIFAKAGSSNLIGLNPRSTGANSIAVFNLSNGEVTSTGGAQYLGSSIKNYGNGWYRCSITFTTGSGSYINRLLFYDTGTYEIYGMQLENSSFTTSYIPTSGSAVTRVDDKASGSGDANTFNDSEGVLMAEFKSLDSSDTSSRRLGITKDGTYEGFRLQLGSGNISVTVYDGATNQYNKTVNLDNSIFHKVALKYKANDFALWIDGIEYFPQSSGSTFVNGTLNDISFDYVGGNPFRGSTKQLQYFDSALNDSELETLTSWTSFKEMANGQSYTII
mgnify:CR=1 FL=1